MDGKKFDEITRGLAKGLSRRQVIKSAGAGALGALTGVFGAKQIADAAPPKPTPTPGPTPTPDPGQCVSFHTTGQGCNNPPGNNCCATDFCIGDNANNPGAGKCGSCPAGTTFCPGVTAPGVCCDNITQGCNHSTGTCCTLPVCPTGANCGTVTNACGTVTCGTACTGAGDDCHNPGTCVNNICTATNKPNGTPCDDLNACTTGDTCQNGTCTPGTAKVCTASDQCHVAGTCDPATGNCSNPNATDGTSCNDNNACTSGDTCQAGVCTGGTATVCTALDQCHDVGTCDPATGACSNPPKADGTACSDGNACTVGDACQAGACVAGPAIECSASDQCHDVGTCDPSTGQCSNPAKADGTACNDGNACTQTDTCQNGACTGSNPVVCTALDQCHDVGVCDTQTGLCSNPPKADGTSCGDGNACTQTDTCQSGACTGSNPVVCAPPGQCQQDGICDESTGECTYANKPDGTPCNDNNACTQTDTCQAGACVGGNPVVCTPSDQCHVAGICNPVTGLCSNPPIADGTACNDGDACTQTDTCQAGTCTGGNPVICTALDQCHVAGTCDPQTGLCSNPNATDGTTCDDHNACTQTDTCQGGTCTGSNPVVCTPLDDCHVAGTCDPGTGACSNPDAADGTGCDDSDACTKTDTCQKGICTGGDPVVCPAPDQCHDQGTCDPSTGLCSNPAKTDGTACNDGNACTRTDTCINGSCVGGNPVVCTALDQCHDIGTCDQGTGVCSNPAKADGAPCDDGNACTTNDTCQGGACMGGPSPCNANNCEDCNGGSCASKCSAGTHCDGSGHCVCTDEPASTTCAGRTCGTYPNNCGHSVDCGTCSAANCLTCSSSGTCVSTCAAGTQCNGSGSCVCVPNPNPCGGAVCGSVTDSCGNVVSCGSCPGNQACSGGICVNTGCTSNKDCPGPGKCCCFNSKSQKGTCSDVTGCGNGKNIACLPS